MARLLLAPAAREMDLHTEIKARLALWEKGAMGELLARGVEHQKKMQRRDRQAEGKEAEEFQEF